MFISVPQKRFPETCVLDIGRYTTK